MRTRGKNKPTVYRAGKRGQPNRDWIYFCIRFVESGPSFLDQSQGEVKQKQSNLEILLNAQLKIAPTKRIG